MRILHLLASPVFSGPAENVLLLAAAQRALGHEVSVAVDRKRPGLSSEEPLVPRLRAAGLLDEGGLELSVKSMPWSMAKDAVRLRRREVDVLHSHFSHDHVLARFNRPRGAVLVRSVHAPRSFRALPAADAYTVPSAADLARVPEGKPAIRLAALVAPEFAPADDREALRRELGISGAPVFGMVSTFQPSRNHLLGLAAFARICAQLPAARLVLVGDGELEPVLRARAEALGIASRVQFAGYQSGPAFTAYLQTLEQVWVLGLGNDWSGRVAAQARACGVRTLAVDQGALGENADVLLGSSTTEEELAEAALSTSARELSPSNNDEIAASVVALYARAGARS